MNTNTDEFPVPEFRIRRTALQMALEHHEVDAATAEVIRTARDFYYFLAGDHEADIPAHDPEGVTLRSNGHEAGGI